MENFWFFSDFPMSSGLWEKVETNTRFFISSDLDLLLEMTLLVNWCCVKKTDKDGKNMTLKA